MFARSVFDGSRSGDCECVHRKRLVILKQERKSLLKKVPRTFSLPGEKIKVPVGGEWCTIKCHIFVDDTLVL